MKLFKFLFCIVPTILLLYVLNNGILLNSNKIPPFGKFLSPFTGFWQNAESSFGIKPDLKVSLKGLSAPVNVVYDARMVPHIFAENMNDAIRTQGYVTASMRLWQMDFQTRAAAGRLAEILGAGLNNRIIAHDKNKRRMGMTYGAELAVAEWKKDKDNYQTIVAFTEGVNAYIDQLSYKELPLEYKLLNFEPEPWSDMKSACLLMYMANDLTGYEDDLEFSNAYGFLGEEKFKLFYPGYFEKQSPVIPSEEYSTKTLNETDSSISEVIVPGHIPTLPKPSPNLGSNNWAVAGTKTKSGYPILCNDPHLGLNLPSIWFETQLITPETNVYGANLPGAPGIVIGFNENIAWGVTNVSHDVKDWYRIKWKDSKKLEYELDGKFVEADLRIEEIKVYGGRTVVDTVRYTYWGPVTHIHPEADYADLAMRWIGHDPRSDAYTFLHLNKAKNYEDYVEAIKYYDCPAQNFVFASKSGDIALWVNGKLPVKNTMQGAFVQDGSLTSNAWKGFIPRSENPHMKNPKRGFVSSTNQHSTTPEYPYYYNGNFDEHRGRYLNRELEKMNNITAEDMMKLQNDNHSLRAEEFVPVLLRSLNMDQLDSRSKKWISKLDQWDFKFDKTSALPVLFNEWLLLINEKTWDEWDKAKYGPLVYPENYVLLDLLENDSLNKVFDLEQTPEIEDASDIVTDALLVAAKSLDNWESEQNKSLNWRDFKRTKLRHLARLDAFSILNVDIGGDKSALNAVSSTNGPSWRMIVEFGEEVKAYGLYPGGQSGNPGSPYYTSMVDKWTKGEYYRLNYLKSIPDSARNTSLFTSQN